MNSSDRRHFYDRDRLRTIKIWKALGSRVLTAFFGVSTPLDAPTTHG